MELTERASNSDLLQQIAVLAPLMAYKMVNQVIISAQWSRAVMAQNIMEHEIAAHSSRASTGIVKWRKNGLRVSHGKNPFHRRIKLLYHYKQLHGEKMAYA